MRALYMLSVPTGAGIAYAFKAGTVLGFLALASGITLGLLVILLERHVRASHGPGSADSD
jgi:hypothetical protein